MPSECYPRAFTRLFFVWLFIKPEQISRICPVLQGLFQQTHRQIRHFSSGRQSPARGLHWFPQPQVRQPWVPLPPMRPRHDKTPAGRHPERKGQDAAREAGHYFSSKASPYPSHKVDCWQWHQTAPSLFAGLQVHPPWKRQAAMPLTQPFPPQKTGMKPQKAHRRKYPQP